MDKTEILSIIAKQATDLILNAVKEKLLELNVNEIKDAISKQLDSALQPLLDEAEKTESYWVKFRNKFYVTAAKQLLGVLTTAIEAGLKDFANAHDNAH